MLIKFSDVILFVAIMYTTEIICIMCACMFYLE